MANLVLGRRAGESIEIGDDIRIDVVSVERGLVKIGITAPRQVPVHRGEVSDRIRAEKAEAAEAEEAVKR